MVSGGTMISVQGEAVCFVKLKNVAADAVGGLKQRSPSTHTLLGSTPMLCILGRAGG